MSVATCLSSRPPLVVFVLGLLAFALSTLILANVVREREDLRNPDLLDWNTFFHKISELGFCLDRAEADQEVQAEGEHQAQPEVVAPAERRRRSLDALLVEEYHKVSPNETRSGERANASALVPITASFARDLRRSLGRGGAGGGPLLVRGPVEVNQMDRGRLGRYRDLRLTLTLSLSALAPAAGGDLLDEEEDREICVYVDGPARLLRDLNLGRAPSNCSLPDEAAATPPVAFRTHSPFHLPADWCSTGTPMTLSYEARPDWTSYLSEDDRALVHLHLMCTSAFLFFLAASVVLAGVLRSAAGGAAGRPLTKRVDDNRGHVELLPQSVYSDSA